MADRSDGVYVLAAQLSVQIGEACDRAGIARSTPPRWRQGMAPRAAALKRLRDAILAIAKERGTVPVAVAGEQGSVAAELSLIRGSLDRIEAALGTVNAA